MEEQVVDTFATYKARYGAPRIAQELQALGRPCSTNYIANIMKTQGIKARNGKAFTYGSHALTQHNVADNLLWRRFGADKPNEKWEFSLRWVYAGGAPFTPLDIEASQAINRSVYDESRVMEDRYPDYHSLNLRVDRRYNFSNSNMIVYFSVWNAYNRENIATYYWNEVEKKQDQMLQWAMLPIFGIEFEF